MDTYVGCCRCVIWTMTILTRLLERVLTQVTCVCWWCMHLRAVYRCVTWCLIWLAGVTAFDWLIISCCIVVCKKNCWHFVVVGCAAECGNENVTGFQDLHIYGHCKCLVLAPVWSVQILLDLCQLLMTVSVCVLTGYALPTRERHWLPWSPDQLQLFDRQQVDV